MRMRVLVCVYVVQILTLVCVALREATRPARGMTWLLVCALLPGIGVLLYLWFTRPPMMRRPQPSDSDRPFVPEPLPDAMRRLAVPLTRLTGTSIERARVRVLADGDAAYSAMLSAIRSATQQIDVEFYIYRSDTIGRRMAAALAERARSGVRVRVLLDGWGSRKLGTDLMDQWRDAGVELRWLFPLPPLGRWRDLAAINYRDHCKTVVIDRRIGYTGGINVGLEYTGRKPGVGPWRDTQIELAGPAAARLQTMFEMNWRIATPVRGRDHRNRLSACRNRPLWATESAEELVPVDTRNGVDATMPAAADPDLHPTVSRPADAWVQLVESGPDERELRFRDVYFTLVTSAEHSVDITTPYFAPSADILTALTTAARRGVRVRLLLPKVPDHRLIAWAERTYYPDLLDAGVDVYVYEAGVLHAKVMTVDGQIGVVGAANYDWRSFRLDFEIGAIVYEPAVVQALADQFEQDLRHATALSLQQLAESPWWRRVLDRSARLFSPFL
jgi:cardiolipin synthase